MEKCMHICYLKIEYNPTTKSLRSIPNKRKVKKIRRRKLRFWGQSVDWTPYLRGGFTFENWNKHISLFCIQYFSSMALSTLLFSLMPYLNSVTKMRDWNTQRVFDIESLYSSKYYSELQINAKFIKTGFKFSYIRWEIMI
jgi:hypothetical protein